MADLEKNIELADQKEMALAAPEKKTGKKWVILGIALLAVAAIAVFVLVGLPAIRYSNGVKAFESGDYGQAVEIFSAFEDYKESNTYLAQAKLGVHYTNAGIKVQAGEYDAAIEEYKNAKDFRDAGALLLETYDLKGEELLSQKKYAQAAEAFTSSGNQDRILDCCILLIEEEKDYAAAVAFLENHESSRAVTYRNYAEGMVSLASGDYQTALDSFKACSGLLDTNARQDEAMFLLAEECLYDGYLNKAKTLYTSLPEGYECNGVASADRIKLLEKNSKFLDMVGSWSATDTYFRVQADSTTSSYYYYWYYEDLNLGTVTVTCPYKGDGKFAVEGTATFPSYQNFSINSSDLKIDLETYHFSAEPRTSVPYQIDSSSTTKLSYSGKQFSLQYKYVNDYSNVYWHYTYTAKATYGTRNMLAEDR